MSTSTDAFSDWDAAYVLGALSPRERLDYEDHLASCPRCTAALAEVAAMPGLLARVSLEEVLDAVDVESTPSEPSASPHAEPHAASHVRSAARSASRPPTTRRRGRRRGRLVAGAVLGLAALTTALVLSIGGVAPPAARAETLHLDSTGQTALTADVRVVGKSWGTAFSTHCRYGQGGARDGGGRYGSGSTSGTDDGQGEPTASDRYGLYVTDSAGDARLVSSWTATPGTDVRADGSTDVRMDQISTVDIRAIGSDDVLLWAELEH